MNSQVVGNTASEAFRVGRAAPSRITKAIYWPPSKPFSRSPNLSLPNPDTRNVERVLGVVADAFDVAPSMLKIRTNQPYLCRPRHIAFWILHRKKWSYPRIGKAFGGFHHTSVIHGVKSVEKQRQSDPAYWDFTNELQARVYRAEEAAREIARVKPLGRVDVLEARIAALEAMLSLSGRRSA